MQGNATSLRIRLLSAIALAALAGCGAADLYEAPESPFHVIGRVPLPSANEGVAALGDYAYVAGGQAGLHVIDISVPGAPVLVATINTTKYAENVEVVRTFADGVLLDMALVVEGTEGITTYDVTDPTHVVSFEQGTTAVDGNRLVVVEPEAPDEPFTVFLAESWKGVRVFTANPDYPGVLDYGGVFAGTQGFAMGLAERDGYLYVADDEMGLAVLDARILELNQIVLTGWADTPGNALDVVLDGDYAYVADGVEGLAVFRIAAGAAPVKVAQLDLAAYSRSLVVSNGWALLCAADGGVHVVDVSDPEHPSYAGNVPTGYASDLAVTPSGHVLVADRSEGLLVLAGPDMNVDARAPAPVTDLRAAPLTSVSVRLDWTAVGDDGYYGAASAYALRRAQSPILDAVDWDAAAPVPGLPVPAAAGRAETFVVTGLTQNQLWHFALRAVDDEGRIGALGNDCAVTTPVGTFLAGARVDRDVGVEDTVFRYEVVYHDAEGDPATVHEVLIDGVAFDMVLESGAPADGALYVHQTTLGIGQHDYAFRFDDGNGNLVETGTASGPAVGAVLFRMGSDPAEYGRREDEPLHDVLLSRDVVAAATEVTEAEYAALTPGFTALAPDLPVAGVDWYDALRYCNALSLAEDRTPAYVVDGAVVTWDRAADGWRLPTEAEWEYLCRAGSESSLPDADVSVHGCGADPELERFGWYCGNAAGRRDVGQKSANAFGLYDMHGNVREWCWDWYGEYGPAGSDPAGPDAGEQKVVRGGSWPYHAEEGRSAARATFYPGSADDFVGFRVVRNR